MTLSEAGLAHLVFEEGMVLRPYHDFAGYLTIGVGHLLTPAEKARGTIVIAGVLVPWQDGLTKEQALALCAQDCAWAERAVNKLVVVALEQHQFDALVSFVFNVGTPNFEKSTLLRLLNQGHYDSVPDQLRRWVYAAKKRSSVLVARRGRESRLWRGA